MINKKSLPRWGVGRVFVDRGARSQPYNRVLQKIDRYNS